MKTVLFIVAAFTLLSCATPEENQEKRSISLEIQATAHKVRVVMPNDKDWCSVETTCKYVRNSKCGGKSDASCTQHFQLDALKLGGDTVVIQKFQPYVANPGHSTVIILNLLIISINMLERKLDFPELLVPAIIMDLVPSTRKLINPAARGVIVLYFMNNGRVHGLSLCLLKENARPFGFNGFVIVDVLTDAPGSSSSVSRMTFASSSGLPDIILSFDAQDSHSLGVGMIFVLQSS